MGAQEKSPTAKHSMQRVKVYRLSGDGKWDDQGTGHVTVDYLERSEELGLFVIDEEDNETLLSHRISSDDIYRKQEDTIISWRDPEFSTELALSFQETTGCSYIWDNICSVQRNMHFNTLNNETYHSVNSELRELPAVELSTLPIILKMSSSSVNGGTSDQLTYCNRNYSECHKKATIRISETERNRNKLFYCCQNCGDFIGWCLPTNSQGRGEGVMQMENMPTVTEQQLRLMNEQLRFQSEELQFLRAKMLELETDINQNSCRIYGLFILLVIGIVLVIKM